MIQIYSAANFQFFLTNGYQRQKYLAILDINQIKSLGIQSMLNLKRMYLYLVVQILST